MKPLTLQEDLIVDFQEQKRTIAEQIALIDPMATSLRRPAARRLLHEGLLIFLEILCWLLLLCSVAFFLFADKLYPFYYLNKLAFDSSVSPRYPANDIDLLHWIVKGSGLLLAVLFFIIARMLSVVRAKNRVLHTTGKNMKLLAEQLLKRKAGIAALEQRHPVAMPSSDDDIIINNSSKPHDDILL